MTLPTSHLSTEAVAALVDGELVPIARSRALAHAAKCAECADAIQDQREAKGALTAALAPDLPTGLLAKLTDIPFTTELDDPGGWKDRVLVADHGRLEVSSDAAAPMSTLTSAAVAAPLGSAPALGSGPRLGSTPAFAAALVGPGVAAGIARSAGSVLASGVAEARARRLRRSLVGAAAGLTIGVLSAAAPQAVAAHGGEAEFQPTSGGDVQQVDFVSSVTDDQAPAGKPDPTPSPVGVNTLPTR